jgi:hypothetical protein
MFKKAGHAARFATHRSGDTTGMENAQDDDDDGDNDDPEEGDAQAERLPFISDGAAAEKRELQAELKAGDYQILVNIIEVKDVVPLDLNGLADPLVSVEVLKDKRFTKVKAGALNATFNELFTFNFDSLGREDLEAASIKITVFDADT